MKILKIGKKILNLRIFRKIKYRLNYNQVAVDDFVINTARPETKSGSRILDAGAGAVKYKKYFPDCDYKTQDFKQYQGSLSFFQYGKIDYVSDITKIPVKDNSFDVIICTDVFEHLPRPDLAIKEFSRILKPGGKVYITSCLVSGLHQPPYHYYSGFTPYWYQKFLSEYGFKNIAIKTKKRFFAFYAQETLRALVYLVKSKKLRHKIIIPLIIPLIPILPVILFGLDKHNLDEGDPGHEFTMGYLVKAEKI